MQKTDNYIKHTHWNPIQRFLISVSYFIVFRFLREIKAENILDVGCGEGTSLNKIKQQRIGKKFEGVEYLQDAIDLGKKLYPDLKITKGNIYDLPYKDNSFDTVLCTEVLEHLEDPEKGFKELVRVSSKYILISVPHEPFFRLENLVRFKNVSRLGNDIEHINHWGYFSLKGMLKKERVEIVHYWAPMPLPLLIVLMRKVYS